MAILRKEKQTTLILLLSVSNHNFHTRVQAQELFTQLIETKRSRDHRNCTNIIQRNTSVEALYHTIFIKNV